MDYESHLLRDPVKINDSWMVHTWCGAWSGRPVICIGFLLPTGPVTDWKGIVVPIGIWEVGGDGEMERDAAV